jgi:chaperone required for assembly of F1-ATPase
MAVESSEFQVMLDDRPARTPAGRPLRLPTSALAQAVAAEWEAQTGAIRPHDMPLTALAATAIDRVGPQRPAIVDAVAAYGATDLLCYWADQPAELVERQHRVWQPLLDWARETCGARLEVTAGVIPVAQPDAATRALRSAVEALDDMELTALASAVQVSGSLVLGLALLAGRLEADAAFAAALLDERYQAEQWGEDEEAGERRRRLRQELDAVARFLALVRSRVSAGGGRDEERQ